MARSMALLLWVLVLTGCNTYNLRFAAEPQPQGIHLFADYTPLQDAVGVSIDTDGHRLEEVYIRKSDGTIARPINISYPPFAKNAAIGVGTGFGTGSVGLGTGFLVPVGSDSAQGLTTATFSSSAIGPPPWELHMKVQGYKEGVVPALGDPIEEAVMLLAGLLILIFGAGLWLLSRQGLTAGTHPFCRACRFDLYMLPLDHPRCPECGADILAEGAVTIGRRKPVRTGMAVGGAVVLAGALLCGLGLVHWWHGFDGSAFKPTTALEREVLSPDERLRGRSSVELQRRIRAGALDAAQMDRLAAALLPRQIDPTAPWDPRWGDLIQRGHVTLSRAPGHVGTPLLSPGRWETFLRQSLQLSARLRPRVRSGDPIPIGLTCKLNAGTEWLATQAMFTPEVTVGGQSPVAGRGQTCPYLQPMEWTLLWQPPEGALGALLPGAHLVPVTVTISVQDGAVLARRTAAFTLPLEMLAADASSVALHTPSVKEQAEFDAAFHWRLRPGEGGGISMAGGTLGKIWVSGPPVTAAYRVVLRQGEGNTAREWLLSHYMVRPDDAATVPLILPAVGPAAGMAEIVCLPDPTLAAGTVDVMEVWGTPASTRVMLVP